MFKKTPLAAAIVASLALAACGSSSDKSSSDTTASGGGSNKAVSYSEFSKQADAYCVKVSADIKPLSDQVTGDPTNDAPILKQILAKVQTATDGLDSLTPPAELQAAYETFKADTQAQLEAEKAAAAAADTGDATAYQTALKAIEPLGQKSNEDGSKLGAVGCTK